MVFSLERWVGKVAIVTGASAGIGAAIVEALVNEGLKVVGIARRKERIDELASKLKNKKGKLYSLKADLTNEEDILRAFEWVTKNVGPVSILVNNAGAMTYGLLLEGSTEGIKRTLDLNVLGLTIATREAVKIMRQNNIDGHIILMNSVAGHRISNFPGMNIYGATKYAVTALTETIRVELNHLGSKTKVTSISPGYVETEFQSAGEFPPELMSRISWKGLASEDIADAAVYVLSTPPHVQVHELTIKPVGEKS